MAELGFDGTTFLNLAISLVAIIVLQIVGMLIFFLKTPFNDMDELKKGNVAVGLALGGKFIATGIILGISAYTNTSIWFMAIWFLIGQVCLVIVYWVFDLVTPKFKVAEQLEKGNVAVGLLLCAVFIGTAISISSLII
ncbi:DUF350 domain-containing protein [Saccharibacillus sp. CPCC 101409]|uniref:DUF350 domain-containing protein n=1 Tax=Saccharibacillus sp. CPCC 101409 TaxID=3058041 RepID=UPI002673F186|nr:DUF350 domain-containing protein [Saccharibacillus sp. CPCC 101409]MDO3409956.1 DUF350 domain-containing protein [Saccharibacillus sp. CPCC 101409]